MPLVVTSWASKVHRASGSSRGKPSVIMHIGFFACSWHISWTQSFQENHHFLFQAHVVLKPPVTLIGILVTCGARISVDTQTDKPTTVTLAVHARRGLIICSTNTVCAYSLGSGGRKGVRVLDQSMKLTYKWRNLLYKQIYRISY